MNAERLLNVMKMRALQLRMRQKAGRRGKRLQQMKMLKTYASRLTKTATNTTAR